MKNNESPPQEQQPPIPPRKPWPEVATERKGQAKRDTKTKPTTRDSKGVPRRSWIRSLSTFIRNKGCMGNVFTVLFILIVLTGVILYSLEGRPFFEIGGLPPAPTQLPTDAADVTISSEPAFVILGHYDSKIFTYNRGIDKIYAYSTNTLQEQEIIGIPKFETFLWHNQGKVLLVSDAHNVLGNIYLLDLAQPITESTQSNLETVLVTNRDEAPNFPRNLKVEGSLPIVWSEDGSAVAFVARDVNDNRESLLIYELASQQLIFTPARNLERISSVLWISDTQLALVAISDDQENRYFVDRSGGGFAKWTIK